MADYFKDLAGKWALVLGASSGFGGAISVALARAGMHICGVHLDRKQTLPNVEKIIAEVRACDRQALFFNVNAAYAMRRTDVLGALEEKAGKGNVMVLVHTLAFGATRPFIGVNGEAVNQSQIEMTVDVMANSLVYWTQDVVARGMIGRGGRIFAMTSAGAQKVWKTYGPVSAAKAALESHVRQLALELGPLGITANSIRAGVTDTPALRKIQGYERMVELATARNPGQRLTTPEDVANAIVAFSLPHTQWMTGNVIGVDGGENIVE